MHRTKNEQRKEQPCGTIALFLCLYYITHSVCIVCNLLVLGDFSYYHYITFSWALWASFLDTIITPSQCQVCQRLNTYPKSNLYYLTELYGNHFLPLLISSSISFTLFWCDLIALSMLWV